MIWLIAVHPLLTGKAKQPSEFEKHIFTGLNPGWSWSHLIRGECFMRKTKNSESVEFIPEANLAVFNDQLKSAVTEPLFYEWLDSFSTDAILKENLYELPERFLGLYLQKGC